MRFRVDLRRVPTENSGRIEESLRCDADDTVAAAQHARGVVASAYQEPEEYWYVVAVVPVRPLGS
jgi:hypothetical protein